MIEAKIYFKSEPHVIAASPSLRGAKRRSNPVRSYSMKQGYIYILFNKRNGTLYVGVTSNLIKRVYEHKNKLADGFTKRYNVDKLGYYEIASTIEGAIIREKQIKGGSRNKKLALIEGVNPNWNDLYNEIL